MPERNQIVYCRTMNTNGMTPEGVRDIATEDCVVAYPEEKSLQIASSTIGRKKFWTRCAKA